MKNKKFILFLFTLFTGNAYSQEMLGIANSNFAGNMGVEMNPSHIAWMPYKWEVNFISADIFVQNDYLYFPAGHVPLGKFLTFQAINKEEWSDRYTLSPKNLYGHLFLKGPSLLWKRNDRAYGIHTALRMDGSAEDVSYHLAKFIWEGFTYSPHHDINYLTTPYKATVAAWGELGFSYGQKLAENEKGSIYGGATLNGLLGLDGIAIRNYNMDYVHLSADTLIIHNMNTEYSHALPEDKDKDAPKIFNIRGLGAGLNIGFTYFRNRDEIAYSGRADASRFKKYTYRAGISLIDLGFITFNKQAKKYNFQNVSAFWPGIDTTKFRSITYTDFLLNDHFYGKFDQGLVAREFTIYLPSAISAQFDYNLFPSVFINVTHVQGFKLAEPAIKRPSQVSVTARYEKRKFEVAVPFSMYELKYARLGIAIRYGILVLGTDKLGAYTGLYDFDGFDFYFGLKYGGFSDLFGKKGKNGESDCPAYK